MNRKITQNDVAQRAGVTRSMVSYILNGNGRSVAPKTRQKILNAISELGYRPNKYAQALSKSNKGSLADRHIGIVLYNVEMLLRPYYSEILAGIHSAANENDYHIRFIRFFEELKDPVLFNQLIHSEEICGLLLVALDQCIKTKKDRLLIEQVIKQVGQIVCVDWRLPGLSSILFDRQTAALSATSYLFERGYRDIVYLGEPDQRINGFKQAFLEQGIKDISELYIDDTAEDMASGYQAIQKLHSSRKKLPRSIFAGSDEVAIGILLYLNEQNISVPEQVAIISIDNIEIAAYTNPQLTTMNVQKRAMGRRAVEMIINRSAEQGENAINMLLPTNLVIRKSV